MPHSFGLRARTRHMFSRKFREHGPIKLSTYLRAFYVGDIVDIKANAAIHRGMPHKYYHGKTGIVYNVTKHAVGVIVRKQVGNRQIEKRVNIRIEHVKHSKCRDDFIARVKRNMERAREAKANNTRVQLKRLPAQPREGRVVSSEDNEPETLSAIPYEDLL